MKISMEVPQKAKKQNSHMIYLYISSNIHKSKYAMFITALFTAAKLCKKVKVLKSAYVPINR